MMMRRKNEAATRAARHGTSLSIGSSFSSNAYAINAQQVLVCKRIQQIKRRLRPYGIVSLDI
ncbi:MAG: hypothetical protein PUB42_06615 [Firmicutes bacterium]|nr:hypothetical protein [Bacillota bacterium]